MSHAARELLKKFKTLKTLPHIAVRLTQMFADSRTTVHDIEEVMSLDPTLVLRVMKLINSAYYGLRRKVDSVSDAIVYLGTDILRNIVVMAAVKELFEDENPDQKFSRKRLWFHCAVVGISSQMIFERMFNKKSENVFLCGILHEIGLIVVDQVYPDFFEVYLTTDAHMTISVNDYEKREIGTDHCEIGYLLSKEWKLPGEVCEGIRGQHPRGTGLLSSSPAGAIQISEYLSSKLGYWGLNDQVPVLSPDIKKHIMDHIMDYKVILADLPGEIDRAREIYQIDKGSSE